MSTCVGNLSLFIPPPMLLTKMVPIMAATVLVVGSTVAEAVHHCTKIYRSGSCPSRGAELQSNADRIKEA